MTLKELFKAAILAISPFVIMYTIHIVFIPPTSGRDLCESLCAHTDHGPTSVHLHGAGGCICNNPDGDEMYEGYIRHVGGRCMPLPDGDRS